jgi:tetratricopeptide (TPR) repeat protein
MDRQRVAEALKLLERANDLGVQTRVFHICKARYLKLLGKGGAAAVEDASLRTLESPSDLHPEDHFLVGYELYSQRQWARASQEFRQALQSDPEHFWARYFLGICYVMSEQFPEAVGHLTLCERRHPELTWIYLLRGFALGKLQRFEEAEDDFNKASKMANQEKSKATLYALYNNRGVMRVFETNKAVRAKGVEDLKKATVLFSDKYDAWYSLAQAYLLDDQFDEAAKSLDTAIVVAGRLRKGDLNPATLAEAHYQRARLSLQRSKQEAALRDLVEAERLAEDAPALRAQAAAYRGRILHLQKNYPEAQNAYLAALEADPGRVYVHLWLGEVLLAEAAGLEKSAKHDVAESTYRAAVAELNEYLGKNGEPSAMVYQQLALAYAQLGQHMDAFDNYSMALKSNPNNKDKPLLYRSLGQECLAIQRYPVALDSFQKALQLDPENADAYLGRAYARVGLGDIKDIENGVADAEEAVKRRPKELHVYYGAARVYAQAAAKLPTEPGQAASQPRNRSRYQARAELLLYSALLLVPASGRAAWREKVRTDKALYPIRRRVGKLLDQFGNAKP